MYFAYTAKRADGHTISSTVEADSLTAARAALRREGLFVLKIGAQAIASRQFELPLLNRRGKTGRGDLMMFFSQLNVMCQAGIELAESLRNATQQVINPAFRKVLEAVCQDVEAGVAFSEALSRHPKVFSPTLVAGISAGEQTGDLGSVLERLSLMVRNEMKLQSNIRGMLMYPAVLAAVTMLVLVAMIFIILPQFARVFEDMEKTPPALTQVVIGFGVFMRSHWLASAGFMAVAAFGFATAVKTPAAARAMDEFLLKFRLCRKTSQSLLAGRMLRLMGTLLGSGVPLLKTIELCRSSCKNRLYQELLTDTERSVINGEGLAAVMMQSTILPGGVPQMIQTAERSGKLGQVLLTIGEFYEEEGERRLRDLVKIAEPVIIVALGGIVALIMLSILVPMMDVTTGKF